MPPKTLSRKEAGGSLLVRLGWRLLLLLGSVGSAVVDVVGESEVVRRERVAGSSVGCEL